MNFWGIDNSNRPTRLYIEIGDPSDNTVMTSMYMLDKRLAQSPTFVGAWWTLESPASTIVPEREHARHCGKTASTRVPSCAICFDAGL